MKIDKVTLTGADVSIKPEQLIAISDKYDFVEWGILLSQNIGARNRFPDRDWLVQLAFLWYQNHNDTKSLKLAGHICGQLVRDIVAGEFPQIDLWCMFRRLQLNFHAIPHEPSDTFPDVLKEFDSPFEDFQYIFQVDNVNDDLFKLAKSRGINAVGLFDLSHGAGILPDEWPKPNGYCGYSGGLGPDNLREQLLKIEEVVEDGTIWIDMETKIRSNNDKDFDLGKCIEVLEIVKEF